MSDARQRVDERSEELVSQIMPLLAGVEPEIIGVVLCELTAILVAGHHPAFRESLIDVHYASLRKMIPVMEATIIEQQCGGVRPEGW